MAVFERTEIDADDYWRRQYFDLKDDLNSYIFELESQLKKAKGEVKMLRHENFKLKNRKRRK